MARMASWGMIIGRCQAALGLSRSTEDMGREPRRRSVCYLKCFVTYQKEAQRAEQSKGRVRRAPWRGEEEEEQGCDVACVLDPAGKCIAWHRISIAVHVCSRRDGATLAVALHLARGSDCSVGLATYQIERASTSLISQARTHDLYTESQPLNQNRASQSFPFLHLTSLQLSCTLTHTISTSRHYSRCPSSCSSCWQQPPVRQAGKQRAARLDPSLVRVPGCQTPASTVCSSTRLDRMSVRQGAWWLQMSKLKILVAALLASLQDGVFQD